MDDVAYSYCIDLLLCLPHYISCLLSATGPGGESYSDRLTSTGWCICIVVVFNPRAGGFHLRDFPLILCIRTIDIAHWLTSPLLAVFSNESYSRWATGWEKPCIYLLPLLSQYAEAPNTPLASSYQHTESLQSSEFCRTGKMFSHDYRGYLLCP